MHTLTVTRPAALRTTGLGLGSRFVFWLVALDAGYRGARKLADATDGHLADMGITRAAAEAEALRHTGTLDTPARSAFGAW
jgi:uncharacterized protein YjiS (DUF1127 family)